MRQSLRIRPAPAAVIALTIVGLLSGCSSGPDHAELQRRLDAKSKNPTLRTPIAGAELTAVVSRLCRDSEPPAVEFQYRFDGTFEDVVTFYEDLLGRAGWRHTQPVAFEHHNNDWVAVAVLDNRTYPVDELAGRRGYGIWVRVDDGYESGC